MKHFAKELSVIKRSNQQYHASTEDSCEQINLNRMQVEKVELVEWLQKFGFLTIHHQQGLIPSPIAGVPLSVQKSNM